MSDSTHGAKSATDDDAQSTTTRRTFLGAAAALSTLPLVEDREDSTRDGDEQKAKYEPGEASGTSRFEAGWPSFTAHYQGEKAEVSVNHAVHVEGEEHVGYVDLGVSVDAIQIGTTFDVDSAREFAEEIIKHAEYAEQQEDRGRR
jgi:hypothetical protein